MSPASDAVPGRALRHGPDVITVVRGVLIPSGVQYVWIWGRRAQSLRRALHTGQR
jgi:hypothetical protein